MQSAKNRELLEIEFWNTSEHERPGADSIYNLINKMADCGVFIGLLEKYGGIFRSSKRVLEIGGGQGWASCILKKLYPHLTVILTDIAENAVVSKCRWEKIFAVSVEKAYSCRSSDIPEENSSLDCVFCFAAAHHFARPRETLKEIFRVLKPGGTGLYLHEVSTSRLFYRMARDRVNKTRPVVAEDIIIYRDLLNLGRETGFEASVHFNPSLVKRGPMETVYYFVLSKLPFLQKVLPCTANFIFIKR
jgi:ubiquinone/menaquinone biosynthesis C-methylase UbiE